MSNDTSEVVTKEAQSKHFSSIVYCDFKYKLIVALLYS
jgi:hypothetical protein